MKRVLKLCGWLLLGVGAGTLTLLPFQYEQSPQDLWALAALGVGLLLVIATTRLPYPLRRTVVYSSEDYVPWPVQGLVLLAGLSLIAIPNLDTIRGAIALSRPGGTASGKPVFPQVLNQERLLAHPQSLQTGLDAIQELSGTERFHEVVVSENRITALLADQSGQFRSYDYRPEGTLGGGGPREIGPTDRTTAA